MVPAYYLLPQISKQYWKANLVLLAGSVLIDSIWLVIWSHQGWNRNLMLCPLLFSHKMYLVMTLTAIALKTIVSILLFFVFRPEDPSEH